jgi:hypothetical protein
VFANRLYVCVINVRSDSHARSLSTLLSCKIFYGDRLLFQIGGDPKETAKEAAGDGTIVQAEDVMRNFTTLYMILFIVYAKISLSPPHFPVIVMDLADIKDWIKDRRERLTASDHLTAIDALAMSLNGSESPSVIAAIITTAYSSYVEQPLKTSEGDRVLYFWAILCDAARTFGSAHSRLVDLLHEISKQPDVYATDGSLARAPGGVVYWRDLPGFPFALCDDALCLFLFHHIPESADDKIIGYFHPYDHSPDELDEFLDQAPELLNGTIFAATLFERGFHLRRLTWFSTIDDSLWMGVESSYNDKHFVKAQEWKVLLPAATAWITIAGKTIYKTCLEDHGAGLDLHSQRVWDRARWELWKEQLRGFENRLDFDQKCRGCATRALAKIVKVEEESQV